MHSCLCASGLEFGEELEEDVASTVDISVQTCTALRALEDLVVTQLLVNVTTCTTRLGSEALIHNDDLALAIFTRLVDEPLLESVVRPRQHATRRLAANLALRLLHHLGSFKLGEQNGFVGLDKDKSHLLVDFVDEVPHSRLDTFPCTLQSVTLSSLGCRLLESRLNVIHGVTQSVDACHVLGANFENLARGVVSSHEGAYSRVESNNFVLGCVCKMVIQREEKTEEVVAAFVSNEARIVSESERQRLGGHERSANKLVGIQEMSAFPMFGANDNALIASLGAKLHREVLVLSLGYKHLLCGECLYEIGHCLISHVVRYFLSPRWNIRGVGVDKERAQVLFLSWFRLFFARAGGNALIVCPSCCSKPFQEHLLLLSVGKESNLFGL